MTILKAWSYCFDKWQRPVIFLGATFFIFAIGGLTHLRLFQKFCSWIFIFGLFVFIISFIYQIIRKNKNGILYNILSFVGLFILIFFYGIVILIDGTLDSNDGYADNLKIPKNIQLNFAARLTTDKQRLDSLMDSTLVTTDFQLYRSFQPGIYEYTFWTGRIEKGKIYLRVFEVTHNDPLSTSTLPESSTVEVFNPTTRITKFETTNDFKIYEGDWGKPYAARFEIWFKPDNGNDERMLLQKNYKIEGWQR